jgi:hypothetical protein
MAKKKTKKTIKEHVLSPVSFRRSSALLGLFAIISGLNMYMFIITPPPVPVKQELVSQAELMSVLGKSVRLGDEKKQEYAPFYNKKEVKYWYDILIEKPDFRDAHIILATLAYNDHNCQIAQSHVSTAYSIDPTDIRLEQMKKVIEECNK